eukprot:1157813-Pelagomonas_calceolata.AAC.2
MGRSKLVEMLLPLGAWYCPGKKLFAKSLASKSSCYAIQKLTTTGIINTRHALHFQGTSGGGFAERVAVESGRRRARASRGMADNPSDPLQLYFWLLPRLAVSSFGLRDLWK